MKPFLQINPRELSSFTAVASFKCNFPPNFLCNSHSLSSHSLFYISTFLYFSKLTFIFHGSKFRRQVSSLFSLTLIPLTFSVQFFWISVFCIFPNELSYCTAHQVSRCNFPPNFLCNSHPLSSFSLF